LPSDIIRTPRTVLDGVARDFVSDQEIPHVGESSVLRGTSFAGCGQTPMGGPSVSALQGSFGVRSGSALMSCAGSGNDDADMHTEGLRS
jgi:hypothetical protein